MAENLTTIDCATAGRELDELLDVARHAAQAGARVALDWSMRRGLLKVEEKSSPGDLVSQADRDSERAIRKVLSQRRPDDGVLGEEAGTTLGRSEVLWVVDPIDGTTEYLYGRTSWAVSVAAVRAADDTVLAGVVLEPASQRVTQARLGGGTWSNAVRSHCRSTSELGRALIEINLGAGAQRNRAGRLMDALVPRVRDIRDCGSAAAALAAVATGRVDAYWGPGLHIWDGAAGILLVREAGGAIGDLSSDRMGAWPQSNDVLAGNRGLLSQLREALAGVYRDQPLPGA